MAELEKLFLDLDRNLDEHRTLKQLREKEKVFELDIKNLEKKREVQSAALGTLQAAGSASDEAEFRTNARNWKERNRLAVEITSSGQSIKMVAGDGSKYAAFVDELEQVDLERLRQTEVRLSETLAHAEAQYKDLVSSLGSINKEIEQLEKREEGSALRTEKEMKRGSLVVLADRWAALTLAGTMMRKALERYEKEKQPLVIKEAQAFFSRISLGRYERIFAPLEEDRIYVEDRNGRRKDIQELSRGTAEQLYLSLRFGFIREFSKRAEPLPVVFDDIFVNFDLARFTAALEAVGELTKTHQVFYFTCHPHVDLLRQMVPDLRVIDLSEEESKDFAIGT